MECEGAEEGTGVPEGASRGVREQTGEVVKHGPEVRVGEARVVEEPSGADETREGGGGQTRKMGTPQGGAEPARRGRRAPPEGEPKRNGGRAG